MSTRAVIIDFNGTIDNIDDAARSAFESVFQYTGLDDAEAAAGHALIYYNQRSNEQPDGEDEDDVAYTLRKVLGKQDVQGLTNKFLELRSKALRIQPDVSAWIHRASKTHQLFVYTGQTEVETRAQLRAAGIDDCIRQIYEARPKPNLDVLGKILDEYDLKPSDCIFIGDLLVEDLMPAKILGLKTIEVNPYADRHVQRLEEIEL